MDLTVPNLSRKKSLTDYSSAGEKSSGSATDVANALLEALKAAIFEADSYAQLYINRVKIEEEFVKSLKGLVEKQRELDAKVDGKVISGLAPRSGKSQKSTIRKTWDELRENDWREIETRSHHLESLRQTVINPLVTFINSQERIRKRVKADVKASSTDFEEGSRNLKASRRAYERKCEEMEAVKNQQQAIEDQRALLSPPNRETSLDGRSNSPSQHSPESSASAEPVEIANSSTPASPQLKAETQDLSAGSPPDKKHFLIDALRSKEGWEAARKEAPRKLNALLSRMREGAERGVGGASTTAAGGNETVGEVDHPMGALGLGQGPGSFRSSQNIALKHTKAKREVEEAEKVYRRCVFDLETLRIRREKTLTAALASTVECRKELAQTFYAILGQAERSSMVVSSSIISLHEHGEKLAEGCLQNLDQELAAFEKRLPPVDDLDDPVRYVNYWHGEEDLIFGVSLQDYSRARPPSLELSGQPSKVSPPLLVLKCIEFIDTYALDHPGIYRISARHAAIQDLVHRVEKDEANFKFDPSRDEPATVAGLLKLYLRQLPEPVLPIPWETRMSFTHEREEHIRNGFASLKGRIRRLPAINQVTLRVILEHLAKVAAHSEQNKMTASNLAVVFGPVILSEASFETTSLAAIMEEDKTMEDLIIYQDVINDLKIAGAPILPPMQSQASSLVGPEAESSFGLEERSEKPSSAGEGGASGLKRANAITSNIMAPPTSTTSDAHTSTLATSSITPSSPRSSSPTQEVPELPPRPPPGTYEQDLDPSFSPQSNHSSTLPRIDTEYLNHQRSATLPNKETASSLLQPDEVQAPPLSAGVELSDEHLLYLKLANASPNSPNPNAPPTPQEISSAVAEEGHSSLLPNQNEL